MNLPFPAKIHVSSDAAIKDNAIIINLGDNYRQRMESGLNAQRETWNIIWPSLNKADFTAAISTLKSAGAVVAMTWTSPIDGIAKKYTVVKDSRRIQPLGAGKWRLSISIEQEFEP